MAGRQKGRVFEVELGDETLVVISVPMVEPGPVPALSEAERDVVRLVLAGLDNAAIAKERGTAVRTVANQLASIYRKLGVGSRTELAALLISGIGE